MALIHVPKIRSVRTHREGTRVLLFVDGELVCDVPWKGALEISRALRIKAKEAEALAKANKIIMDQALLTRAGFPIGLTSNPDMKKEAMKEAAWNRDLRRYIPLSKAGNIASGESVGEPTLIKHLPKKGGKDA